MTTPYSKKSQNVTNCEKNRESLFPINLTNFFDKQFQNSNSTMITLLFLAQKFKSLTRFERKGGLGVLYSFFCWKVSYRRFSKPRIPMPLKSVLGSSPWKPIFCHCLVFRVISGIPGWSKLHNWSKLCSCSKLSAL